MALIAARVAEDNGFADIIEVVYGRVEDVELPEQADVLISEWMARRLSPHPNYFPLFDPYPLTLALLSSNHLFILKLK